MTDADTIREFIHHPKFRTGAGHDAALAALDRLVAERDKALANEAGYVEKMMAAEAELAEARRERDEALAAVGGPLYRELRKALDHQVARAEAAEAERDECLEREKVGETAAHRNVRSVRSNNPVAARAFLAQVDLRKAAEARVTVLEAALREIATTHGDGLVANVLRIKAGAALAPKENA